MGCQLRRGLAFESELYGLSLRLPRYSAWTLKGMNDRRTASRSLIRHLWVRASRGPTKLKKINRMMLRSRPMSDKDLQRVTKCVSYIGQEHSRRLLPTRRNHCTQKVKAGEQPTLYLSVHDDDQPVEIFLGTARDII